MPSAAHWFCQSAAGLMASAPIISELGAEVVARPKRFPLRIDEVDVSLEDGELFD